MWILWFALHGWAGAGEVAYDRTGRWGRVVVELDGARRTLTIDDSLQSTWSPESPHRLVYGYIRAAAAAAAIPQPAPETALVIGLGGGTLTRHLRHHYGTEVRAIELDRRVVHAARQWFALPREVHVTVGDGRKRLEQDRQIYDLVVVDAASEHGVPDHLLTLEFLEAVRQHLTPNGLAVANSWAEAPFADRELATWSDAFGRVLVLRSPEGDERNRVLVAGPGLPTAEAVEARAARAPAETLPQILQLSWPTTQAAALRDPPGG